MVIVGLDLLIIFTILFKQIDSVVFNPNCFDYTVTNYESQTDDSFGITTMMKLKGQSLCEYYVYTGISRVIYPKELSVTQYRRNALDSWVSIGSAKTGQTIQWYDVQGRAEMRRFIVNNPTKFPISFRINVQRYQRFNQSIKVRSINAFLTAVFLLFFSIAYFI